MEKNMTRHGKNTWKQIEIEHDGDLNITQMGIYIWELPCKLT